MPTMAIGSSSTRRGRTTGRRVPAIAPTSRSSSRATATGFGWSKTRVAGSRTPVAWLRLLRRSTAVSESKPRSLNARSGSMLPAEACPRAAATCPATSSSTMRSRSASATPASRCASDPPVSARRGAGASPCSGAGSSPVRACARRAGRSNFTGASSAVSCPSAWSNSSSASAAGSAPIPIRASRARSASPSSPSMPRPSAHRPHAREVAGSPPARRPAASASRAALAAA